MNNLPEYIPCNMCPRGKMYPLKKGLFHQYYQCNSLNCKDITGLPLNQHKEKEKEAETDFGSGAYRSEINNN